MGSGRIGLAISRMKALGCLGGAPRRADLMASGAAPVPDPGRRFRQCRAK
jgi:hypothetical protein